VRAGGFSPNEDRYGQDIMPDRDETRLADSMPDPETGRYDHLPVAVDISFQNVPSYTFFAAKLYHRLVAPGLAALPPDQAYPSDLASALN
jgi:hypothetical protein